MSAQVLSIYRHPVKGFTPEALEAVDLAPGEGFPHDRVYAVENGPSGFDPAAPVFLPKQKFTVLASIPRVAAARTRYEPATCTLSASADGLAEISACLAEPQGREAFAAWLTGLLDQDDLRGPLRVVEAPGHAFTDHPLGQVSIINLASLRDLAARVGRPVDPLRFRANLYVDGWPAWSENDWTGQVLSLGGVRAEVFKPIVRCLATHVDPVTAARDMEVVKALFDNYGHVFCGVYVRVTQAGRIAVGDICEAPP